MVNLELKIPQPIVLIAIAAGMWAVAKISPLLAVLGGAALGMFLMVVGFALNIAGT